MMVIYGVPPLRAMEIKKPSLIVKALKSVPINETLNKPFGDL